MNSYNNTLRLLFIGFLSSLLASCSYDREIISAAAPVIPAVENLQVELVGDSAVITWENPAYDQPVTARVSHNNGVEMISQPVAQFKYGIVDVATDYLFTVKLLDAEGNFSPGNSVSLYREGPQAATNFSGVQDGTNINLSWDLPEESVAGVRIEVGGQQIDLPGTATTYTFENSEYATYAFKLNLLDAEGNPSPSKYLNFKVGATKIGYLGTAHDVSSIADDDEKASAAWLFENYPDAEYIRFDDIKAGKDLSEFRVLWWHYDNSSNSPEVPGAAKDPEVIEAISQFHKDGGALLLNTHAVQYLWTIGRMTAGYGTAVGAGEGFDNPDVWGVNINIGRKHDKSGHPLYQGVATNNVDGRKIIPLLGSGWKEDHNYVYVDLAAYYGLGNGDEAAYIAINEDENINILGTWDGISDYFMMGIFETKPTDEYKGTAIAIGLGSVEWNQNNAENPYQENIETITRNALNYLRVQ